MVNRQRRDPGALVRTQNRAVINKSVPFASAPPSKLGAAIASFGNQMFSQFGRLADEAAAREGELAGLTAGQQSGAAYLRAAEAERRAVQRERAENGPPKGGVGVWITERLMQDLGLNRAQAAAFAGNFDYETGGFKHRQEIKPVVPGSRGGFNLAQWTGPRRKAFEAWAGEQGLNPHSWETGYGFLLHELKNTSEGRVLDDLKGVNDPAEAARIVSNRFLRPGVPNINERVKRAQSYASVLPGEEPVAPPKSTVEVDRPLLPSEPLQLQSSFTIRGQAFNAAARNTQGWRVASAITNRIGTLYEEHKDDPAAFEAGLTTLRGELDADPNFADPRVRELVEKQIERKTTVYRADIENRQARRLKQDEVAAYAEAAETTRSDLERQAYTLGANPDGDEILSEELVRASNSIDRAARDGTIKPLQAIQQKDQLEKSVATSRVRGVFDSLSTVSQKAEFAESLLADWSKKKGVLKHLDRAAVKTLSDQLLREARQAESRSRIANRAEASRITRLFADDISSIQATGQGIDFAELGIDPASAKRIVGENVYAEYELKREQAQRLHAAVSGLSGMNEAEITDHLATLAPKPGQAGFVEQQQIFDQARQRAVRLIKERQQDPLKQAGEAGAIELAPIRFESPEELTESLEKRRDDARTVSDLYDTPLTVFRPQERALIARTLTENPQLLPDFSIAIAETFGDAAPRALAEISEHAPVIGQAAALARALGDDAIAEDVSRVLTARKSGAFKLKMPAESKFSTISSAVLGPALEGLPNTRAAVRGLAIMLFEQEANTLGLDVSKLGDEDDTTVTDIFRAQLNRAVGGRTIQGKAFGGITEINDIQTLVPHDVSQDDFENALDGLNDQHLALLPAIKSRNGVPVTARQLRGARLVSQGDGRYFVTLGDPRRGRPQVVFGDNGQPWILDIRKLIEVQGR